MNVLNVLQARAINQLTIGGFNMFIEPNTYIFPYIEQQSSVVSVVASIVLAVSFLFIFFGYFGKGEK